MNQDGSGENSNFTKFLCDTLDVPGGDRADFATYTSKYAWQAVYLPSLCSSTCPHSSGTVGVSFVADKFAPNEFRVHVNHRARDVRSATEHHRPPGFTNTPRPPTSPASKEERGAWAAPLADCVACAATTNPTLLAKVVYACLTKDHTNQGIYANPRGEYNLELVVSESVAEPLEAFAWYTVRSCTLFEESNEQRGK